MGQIVWLPVGNPPDQLIYLNSAVERVVAAKYGVGFVAEWTPATLRGEYEAQRYGGVRTLAWEEARAWILGRLQSGKLTLFRVAKQDPPEIRACASDFWRSSDHDDIQHQKQILDGKEHPSERWIYALDEVVLTSLLNAEVRDKAQSTPREEARSLSLDEAIERAIEAKGLPPRDIRWKAFCHEVRRLCGVGEHARKYGDKTIQNKVRKLGKR